jgi:hypothetical protein
MVVESDDASLVRDWLLAPPALRDVYDVPANKTRVRLALRRLWGKKFGEEGPCRSCGREKTRCCCKRKKQLPLYGEWSAGLLAVGPPAGVLVEVAVVVPRDTYVSRLLVPEVLGRHFCITRLTVGEIEILSGMVPAEVFAPDLEPPPFTCHADSRSTAVATIVNVTGSPASFSGRLAGMTRVMARKRSRRA